MQRDERERRGLLAVNLGLGTNVVLAAVKTVAGVLGHSPALLADGINSTSDVVYYIVVSVFVRMAGQPADEEHPYGHRQLESISALIVGAFVMTTAVAIFWESVNEVYDLWTGQTTYDGPASYALWVAVSTVAIKVGLAFLTRRIGREIQNPAVLALASDHRNDVFSASAAAIGICLGRMGAPWVDPFAGALVALVVLKTGIGIVRSCTGDLMDTVPGKEIRRQVEEVSSLIPGIRNTEDVRAHRFGPFFVINLTIGLDGQMSVAAGDAIATQMENAILKRMPSVQNVYIHYHPAPAELPPHKAHDAALQ